jgi:hypothetical protein
MPMQVQRPGGWRSFVGGGALPTGGASGLRGVGRLAVAAGLSAGEMRIVWFRDNITNVMAVMHRIDPAVTAVTGSGGDVTQADVTDCADSSHWLNYHDGKLVPGQALGHRHIIARLQPFDGTWKVTYLNVGKAGTC